MDNGIFWLARVFDEQAWIFNGCFNSGINSWTYRRNQFAAGTPDFTRESDFSKHPYMYIYAQSERFISSVVSILRKERRIEEKMRMPL